MNVNKMPYPVELADRQEGGTLTIPVGRLCEAICPDASYEDSGKYIRAWCDHHKVGYYSYEKGDFSWEEASRRRRASGFVVCENLS